MSKGYVILAQNSEDDYVKMAYALALSIKCTQKTVNSISLITDVPDAVPYHCREVFDHIIKIPWYDDALNSEWKIENRWKIYHISPYDETVLLDADMIFLTDVSHWWDYLNKNYDLYVTSNVLTYRNEVVNEDFYRKAFVNNNLPNLYSAFTYFKKSELAEEFWKTVEIIVKDWKNFYNQFLFESKPKFLSIDVSFALAAKILGITDQITSKLIYPSFTHMKGRCQMWERSSDNWSDLVGSYLDKNGKLKIGNFQQSGIFHYTEKNFLTDHVLYTFKDLYHGEINE
jgi:hypothetical protein